MIQTQFQTKVQMLKTNNTRDYFVSILNDYILSQRIIHQNSCVDISQQNRVAKRKKKKKKRHLEVARSLMFIPYVPKYFWGKMFLTTANLINRIFSRVNFQTLSHIFLMSHPKTRIISTIPMRMFGCSTYVHIHSHSRSKLNPKALKCLFIGYSSNQKE